MSRLKNTYIFQEVMSRAGGENPYSNLTLAAAHDVSTQYVACMTATYSTICSVYDFVEKEQNVQRLKIPS